jgi:hypothetical protein
MMAPSMIPNKIAMIKEEPLPPDSGGGVIGGVPGGIPGGQVGGVLGGILGGGASPLVSVAALPPPPVASISRWRIQRNQAGMFLIDFFVSD